MLPFLLVTLLVGQSAPPARAHRFSSRSDLVVLHVTVLDRKGECVSGLPRDAFTVQDGGHAQPITFFEHAESAVTIGLVLDSSISMHRKRDAVIAAGNKFAESSHPDDEMFTINFNERVWAGLPPGRPFTSDREELRLALQRSGARGKTALFDAVHAALVHLQSGQRQKKVLIVVSDGGDNASARGFDQVVDLALRMNAVIYTIAIHDEYNREGDKDVLRKLATVTGGTSFFLRTAAESTGALEQIAREIRSGYLVGYVPQADAAGYRPVRVRVRSADSRKLAVRARSGYVWGGNR